MKRLIRLLFGIIDTDQYTDINSRTGCETVHNVDSHLYEVSTYKTPLG